MQSLQSLQKVQKLRVLYGGLNKKNDKAPKHSCYFALSLILYFKVFYFKHCYIPDSKSDHIYFILIEPV